MGRHPRDAAPAACRPQPFALLGLPAVRAALVGFPVWLVAADALADPHSLEPQAAASLLARMAGVAPTGLLALFAATARFAAWHGLVVVSRADIDWLLAAPVPRGRMLAAPLARVLAAGAIAGVLGGLLAGGRSG